MSQRSSGGESGCVMLRQRCRWMDMMACGGWKIVGENGDQGLPLELPELVDHGVMGVIGTFHPL